MITSKQQKISAAVVVVLVMGHERGRADGERILEYADSHDLTIVNTKFRKRHSHLISFDNRNAKTQINYVLVRLRDHGAKTLPYETVET
ncbi:unnamed protein product [Heligmosomoides polygyrus]|uniref:Transposase n=1 Tax=Heligmosomoides polygyrus TaxID=6339 RepID=A0A183G8X4_HELPZ|nr:unnamed protein product [Heligmosomoides polygyrus]